MPRERGRVFRYSLALATVSLTTAVSVGLLPVFQRIPSALYFIAVMVTARYGGLGPSLLASLLSIVAVDYFILPPAFSFGSFSPEETAILAILALVAVFISSVTSRLRSAQEAERRQREWLQTILAGIGDAVIATDAKGRVSLMNGPAEVLAGWSFVDAAGRSLGDLFQIFDERTRQPAESPLEQALREGVVTGLASHTVLRARDGTERPIDDSAAPIRDRDGAVVGAVLIFRDVSQRRQDELAVARSEQRFRAVWDSASDAMALSDPNGILLAANPAYSRLLGYRPEQMLGEPPPAELVIAEELPQVILLRVPLHSGYHQY